MIKFPHQLLNNFMKLFGADCYQTSCYIVNLTFHAGHMIEFHAGHMMALTKLLYPLFQVWYLTFNMRLQWNLSKLVLFFFGLKLEFGKKNYASDKILLY